MRAIGKTWLVLALVAAGAVGCGGGGSSAAGPSIHGVAASGLPISGTVHVIDAAGNTAEAEVAADGSYLVSVRGMTAPFLIEVVGTAGGRPAILHSTATATDVTEGTTVNVTPLTELMTAYVLGTSPAEVFRSEAPDLSAVTDTGLQDASAQVVVWFGEVLDATGAADVDPRTGTFTADGTGMDQALDAIKIVPVQDDSGNAVYEVSLSIGTSAVVVDPADPPPADEPVVTFDASQQTAFETAAAALPDINAQLQGLAAAFQLATPSEATILPFFDQGGFYHNGLALDGTGGWLAQVLLHDDTYTGFTASLATIEKVQDATHILVSFGLATTSIPSWQEWFWMTKQDGKWLISGNQELAASGVNYMARIKGTQGAIEQFAIFWISGVQADPEIASVVVTGPGIPAEGLTLVRPAASTRADFYFEGDSWQWNAFNTARCEQVAGAMAHPETCGLTWEPITSGAVYAYDFYKADDSKYGETAYRRLMGTPQPDAQWLTHMGSFPQLQLTSANDLSETNIHGTPFGYGGTETVTWKVPTDPTVFMDSMDIWRAYGDTVDERERCHFSLYRDTSGGPRSCSWKVNQPTQWAWIDINARDVYGNQLSEEVNGSYPY